MHSLKEIQIPNSVILIGKSVFSECSSLETVNIGENLYIIDSSAFLDALHWKQ